MATKKAVSRPLLFATRAEAYHFKVEHGLPANVTPVLIVETGQYVLVAGASYTSVGTVDDLTIRPTVKEG